MSCAFGKANDSSHSTFFDQLSSFHQLEVAGRHLVYRLCNLNLRFGHRVHLMHILRSQSQLQVILFVTRHMCVSHVCQRVSASAVVLILGVIGTSVRYQKALLSACKGHFKICSKRSNCKFLNMLIEPGHFKCHQYHQ